MGRRVGRWPSSAFHSNLTARKVAPNMLRIGREVKRSDAGSMALPRIYFEKLLESSPDIVVAVDREGSIVFYNDGARQTLGYTSAEVLGKPVILLYKSREHAREVRRA